MSAVSQMNEWITEHSRTLFAIARKFDIDLLDTEDIFHNMIAALLDNAISNPEFVNQNDAYKFQFAKWHASHLLDKSKVYSKYVAVEGTSEDGEESAFDLIADAAQVDPADLLEGDQLIAAVKTLSRENQQIVKLLYVGYSKAEIAEYMNISRPAISQRINTIQKAFACAV